MYQRGLDSYESLSHLVIQKYLVPEGKQTKVWLTRGTQVENCATASISYYLYLSRQSYEPKLGLFFFSIQRPNLQVRCSYLALVCTYCPATWSRIWVFACSWTPCDQSSGCVGQCGRWWHRPWWTLRLYHCRAPAAPLGFHAQPTQL